MYYELHAKRMYTRKLSADRLAALVLARHLRKGWKREEGKFSVRDVYQNNWSGLTSPDETRAALAVLEEANWVRLEPPKSEPSKREPPKPNPGGRPSEVYLINPKIGGSRAGH